MMGAMGGEVQMLSLAAKEKLVQQKR